MRREPFRQGQDLFAIRFQGQQAPNGMAEGLVIKSAQGAGGAGGGVDGGLESGEDPDRIGTTQGRQQVKGLGRQGHHERRLMVGSLKSLAAATMISMR